MLHGKEVYMVNILPETLVIGSLWLDIPLEIPLLCKLPICEASLSSINTAHTAMRKAVLQDDGPSFTISMCMFLTY